jgi:cell division protein FtsA
VWRRKGREQRRLDSPTPTYISVLDPGVTTLRVLVVEVAGGEATVWGWDERPGSADASQLAGACEQTLTRAEELARERAGHFLLADQMWVGFPASQLRGGAWPVVQSRSRPDRPVEEAELEALLARALRLSANRLADPTHPGWFLVDAAAVALTIDGRRVTDPVGFRGKELGATVFAALTRAETVEAWRKVAKEFEFSELILAAAPRAVAAGLAEPQGLLVDVGGATTDVTWWRMGRPLALASLPMGGADLSRVLLQTYRASTETVEELKADYASGMMTPEARAEVLEVLAPSLQMWRNEMEVLLANLDRDEPLPQQIYLQGGGSVLPEITDAVRSLAWSRRLRFVRYPEVGRWRPTDVPGVVNRTDRGRQPGDVTALSLAAWAACQGQAPDRPERILSALCQGDARGA